ncbi:MAG: O-antigen ligase family protein [Candidatus Moranbacteria bacterium]|nr:O-antigen ligase family protein [Candidatus Moranbacteria bacterium]
MLNYLFLFLIFLLPLQFALNAGDNIDLVTTRILVPVLFLAWLVKSLARKKMWIPNKAEMWLAVTFLFLASLSLCLGREASAGFRKLLYLFTIAPVFFVAADIFREEKWRKRALVAIIFSGALAAMVGLFQFLFSFLIGIDKSVKIWEGLAPYFLGNSFGKIVAANSSWLVNIGGVTRMRAFGFFPDPHNFAFFVNLCLFTALGYLFAPKKAVSKLWIGAGAISMSAAVGLSFSRGAYLGLLAGGLFFALIFLKRSGVLGKTLVAIVAIFVLVFIFNSNIITQRLVTSFNLKEGSNAERYKNWTQAAGMIQDYPLGGVGLGNYAKTVDPTAADRSSIYAHNLFLDIAAETGILNAIIFLLLIFVSVWRNIRNNNMLSLGVAAGLIAFLVHSIFDTALYSPQVLTLLLIIIALGLNDSKTPAFAKASAGKQNSNVKITT